MNARDYLKRLNNGEELDDEEMRDLIECAEWDNDGGFSEVVAREYGENRRWQRLVTVTVRLGDTYWNVEYDQGLTEMQEDDWWKQPYEVAPMRKVIPGHEVTVYVQVPFVDLGGDEV